MSQNAAGAQQPAWAWCHYHQLKMNHEAFPKGSYLTKLTICYSELVGKNCVDWSSTCRHTRPGEIQNNQSPNGVFVCMVPPCCTVWTAQCCCSATVSRNTSPLCILMSCLFVRVAADCSVCSAVIWTPFFCWRASTTSAPCCCRVRGRMSLSWTPMRGMNQQTHSWKYAMKVLLLSIA